MSQPDTEPADDSKMEEPTSSLTLGSGRTLPKGLSGIVLDCLWLGDMRPLPLVSKALYSCIKTHFTAMRALNVSHFGNGAGFPGTALVRFCRSLRRFCIPAAPEDLMHASELLPAMITANKTTLEHACGQLSRPLLSALGSCASLTQIHGIGSQWEQNSGKRCVWPPRCRFTDSACAHRADSAYVKGKYDTACIAAADGWKAIKSLGISGPLGDKAVKHLLTKGADSAPTWNKPSFHAVCC